MAAAAAAACCAHLAAGGHVLGGKHGGVGGRLVAVGLHLHATSHAHQRLLQGAQICGQREGELKAAAGGVEGADICLGASPGSSTARRHAELLWAHPRLAGNDSQHGSSGGNWRQQRC